MTEEDWVAVHIAANRGEAELLAGLLRAEGVSVLLRGADLLMEGTQVFPEIVVPRSMAARAKELLDGTERAEDPEPPGALRKGAPGGRTLAFVGGTALGAFVMLLVSTRVSRNPSAPPEETYPIDHDGDGKPDEWERYERGVLVESWRDSNRDGKPDAWQYFVEGRFERDEIDHDGDGKIDERTRRNGERYFQTGDSNLDGREDMWNEYDWRGCGEGRYDLDYDGKPDQWKICELGQVVERRWSLRGDGVVDKKAFYRREIKTEEHFDLDHDGAFELKKELDAFEQEKPRRAQSEATP